jgi:hypothetical protein
MKYILELYRTNSFNHLDDEESLTSYPSSASVICLRVKQRFESLIMG